MYDNNYDYAMILIAYWELYKWLNTDDIPRYCMTMVLETCTVGCTDTVRKRVNTRIVYLLYCRYYEVLYWETSEEYKLKD